jgi:hypothetical protein
MQAQSSAAEVQAYIDIAQNEGLSVRAVNMPAPGRTISLQHIADVYMRCKTAAELSASSTAYIFLSTDSLAAEVMNRVGQQQDPFTLLSEYVTAAQHSTNNCPMFFLGWRSVSGAAW